jgi:hypothetical protein
MVELTATRRSHLAGPQESRRLFAGPSMSLRAHLLRAWPVLFRRKDILIDSTIGDCV